MTRYQFSSEKLTVTRVITYHKYLNKKVYVYKTFIKIGMFALTFPNLTITYSELILSRNNSIIVQLPNLLSTDFISNV